MVQATELTNQFAQKRTIQQLFNRHFNLLTFLLMNFDLANVKCIFHIKIFFNEKGAECLFP